MPYVRVETNVEMRNNKEFCLKLSKVITSLTGKPEEFVMVNFKEREIMSFAGKVDPCVFVELRGIDLDEDSFSEYSQKITSFLEIEMRVPGQRIYLNFSSIPSSSWGYNGDTF